MNPGARILLCSPLCGLALTACTTSTPKTATEPAAEPAPFAKEVLANLDASKEPCDDFYTYACGQWLDRTEIPSDRTRWGRFHELREKNSQTLRTILDEAVASEANTGDVGKVAAYYGSCMDEARVDAASAAPIKPQLDRIAAIKDLKGVMAEVAKLHRLHARPLFAFHVEADYDKPDTNIAFVYQAGLGLPDRDYYLAEDEEHRAILADYEKHVARVLGLTGVAEDVAAKQAKAIVGFETELASAALPRAEMRDPKKQYNKIDREGLEKAAKALPWGAYFEALGYPGVKDISVAPPVYFEKMARAVANTRVETLQAYLRWNVARTASDELSSDFVNANFEFFGKRLNGQAELAPRWKRCVQATDRALGEALGRVFVDREFGGEAKPIAADMIKRIEDAFEEALPELPWMDDNTRARAVEKMKAVVNKIGYPDTWRSYDKVTVGEGYFANAVAAAEFEFDRRTSQIGKPVDKAEWHITAPTVNAYYNPSNNEMVFPAGILQPPFFDTEYPMSMNFGGIGMVMGHELTHGFDDQGRKFDGSGRFTEWWEPAASERFEKQAACVENLYSGYEVQPGVHLNGKLTLGENIADFGGVKQGFRAYTKWAEENNDVTAHVEGLTNEQLFFVSVAQLWCTKATPKAEKVLAATDPHSHPRYRVNGPLSNLPEFWEAFECEEGAGMHPQNACVIW